MARRKKRVTTTMLPMGVRKVKAIKLGPNSLSIVIPADWCRSNKIRRGDVLALVYGAHEIRIAPWSRWWLEQAVEASQEEFERTLNDPAGRRALLDHVREQYENAEAALGRMRKETGKGGKDGKRSNRGHA